MDALFTKVSDFLLGLMVLMLIVYFYLKNLLKKNYKKNDGFTQFIS